MQIPTLHIILSFAPGSEGVRRIRWHITLVAKDCDGSRKLGYRRSGYVNEDLTGLSYETNTQVHDYEIDRWTPMLSTDRKDIQAQIDGLLSRAVKKFVVSGEDSFEHLIL